MLKNGNKGNLNNPCMNFTLRQRAMNDNSAKIVVYDIFFHLVPVSVAGPEILKTGGGGPAPGEILGGGFVLMPLHTYF